ncbi:MAG: MFS transporter [Opitutaceae bacterium]|nr:MFS transporter [Opitutaceae bacterium]
MSSNPSTMRYAWFVVALLFPVALLNYLDRQMIAAMKSSVMQDIPSIGTDANWGYMLGQFKWVYAILSPIGGYIADRFSRRLTICASLFCWSAVTYATGHVTTYDGLLWTRTLMGISEAFYIPAALALIADMHSDGTRSRAIGLHQIGIYCGVITGSFAGYAADSPTLGWRWMFDITGLVGILYTLPLIWLLRDTRSTPMPASGTREVISPARSVRELLTNGAFILLVLYFTLPAIAGWVVRDWMPAILQKELNLKQGLAGVSAVVYWQGAAIFAAIGGGWLADRWMRRTQRGRIYVSAIGMAFIIPAMLGVGVVVGMKSLPLAIGFLILFGVGWGLFDANNMPILSQIVRPELRATGYGVMNFVSISCGGFADYGFGIMRDRQVPLNLIFGGFAAVALLSLVIVLMIKPRPGTG